MSIFTDFVSVTVENANGEEITSVQVGEKVVIRLATKNDRVTQVRSSACLISGYYDDKYEPEEEVQISKTEVTLIWTVPEDVYDYQLHSSMSAFYNINLSAGIVVYGGMIFTDILDLPLTITVPEYTLDPPVVSVTSSLQRDGKSLYYGRISHAIVNFTWPQGKYGSHVSINGIRCPQVSPNSNSVLDSETVVDGYIVSGTIEGYTSPGEYVITAAARDNRGKTSQATATFNVESYFPVEMLGFDAFRCTADGVEDEENGTCLSYYISFGRTGNNELVTQGIAITLYWKTATDVSYSSTNVPWQVGDGGRLTGIIDDVLFSPEQSYFVYAQVTDSFTTATSSTETIPAYGVLLDFRSDGKGLSIGKIATTQTDPQFEIAWPTTFYDTATFKNPIAVKSGGIGRNNLTSGYFLRGNGTGSVALSSPATVLNDIGAMPNTPGIALAGYLGSFTDQSALDATLDRLVADNYGGANTIVASLGVDFDASQAFTWAAASTIIAQGGGDWASQTLMGTTGHFYRIRANGAWGPWTKQAGFEIREIGLDLSGTTNIVTTFSHTPVAMMVDTDYNSMSPYNELKSALLFNQGYYRRLVYINGQGYLEAKLVRNQLYLDYYGITTMIYVRCMAIY